MSDLFNPTVPAGAYDDHLHATLPVARETRVWEPSDGPIPALFVSHGAPPTLNDPQWLRELFDWAQSFTKPRAIVVVSAHWENAPLTLSATDPSVPLYYDFGGFDQRYYTMQYRTPDATALARRIAGSLPDGTQLYQHTQRGLDHGAFIPLMAMYPAADIPVVQLSMPSLDPTALMTLGERLRQLRSEGILVVGSGFMTHSFDAILRPTPVVVGAVHEFDDWVARALATGDVDSIVNYRRKAPGVIVSHPTADHFVPLLVTLGAATDPTTAPHTAIARFLMGNSIRSIQVA